MRGNDVRNREGAVNSRKLVTALVMTSIAALATPARAQSYPDHAVRLIIPFPPGGSIDTLGRILTEKLATLWGQSVFIENRAGAGGMVGSSVAAQAAPDGYTMSFGGQFMAANVTIVPSANFDPVKSFAPVILVATGQDVLMVPADSPFHSVKEVVDYAKAHPGELTYASLGIGSSGQLQAGKLRALAVSGPTRAALLPDVPTFDELGVAYGNDTSWYALFAPAGTPRDVVAKINADTNKILADADMKERATKLGFRLVGGAPEELGAHLRSEINKWAKVAKAAGLEPK